MTVQPPTTVEQLILLIVLVLPGVTYQYLRERRRGPVAAEQVFADRVLRAMTRSQGRSSCGRRLALPAQPSALPWGGREGRRGPVRVAAHGRGQGGGPPPGEWRITAVTALHWIRPHNRVVTETCRR